MEEEPSMIVWIFVFFSAFGQGEFGVLICLTANLWWLRKVPLSIHIHDEDVLERCLLFELNTYQNYWYLHIYILKFSCH